VDNYKYNKKWRLSHPETRYAGKKRYYAKSREKAVRKRAKWQKWEIDLILQKITSDRELAKTLGRSVEAIQIKRTKAMKETKWKQDIST